VVIRYSTHAVSGISASDFDAAGAGGQAADTLAHDARAHPSRSARAARGRDQLVKRF